MPSMGYSQYSAKEGFETCPVWTKKDTKNEYSSGIADFQLFYALITFIQGQWLLTS